MNGHFLHAHPDSDSVSARRSRELVMRGFFACSMSVMLLACGGASAPPVAEPRIPECPVPFREPELGCELRQNGQPGFEWDTKLAWAFPEASNCGTDALHYWLSGEETPRIALEVSSGPGYEGPPREVQIVALVDALAVPFSVDGGAEDVLFRFDLEATGSRFLEVELAGIAPGKHSVHVVAFVGNRFVVPILAASFVALQDATCAGTLPPASPTLPARTQDGMSYLVDRRTGVSFDFFNREVAPDDGVVPLVWHVAADDVLQADRALVAFVDGKQVEFDDLGMRPYVLVPIDSDDRELVVDLARLPSDGREHQAHVLMIGGLDVPVFSAGGEILSAKSLVIELASFRFR